MWCTMSSTIQIKHVTFLYKRIQIYSLIHSSVIMSRSGFQDNRRSFILLSVMLSKCSAHRSVSRTRPSVLLLINMLNISEMRDSFSCLCLQRRCITTENPGAARVQRCSCSSVPPEVMEVTHLHVRRDGLWHRSLPRSPRVSTAVI